LFGARETASQPWYGSVKPTKRHPGAGRMRIRAHHKDPAAFFKLHVFLVAQ